jgi:hypothetical protein
VTLSEKDEGTKRYWIAQCTAGQVVPLSAIVGFELERFFDFEHAGDSHPEITHCAYYVAQPKAEPVNG